MKNSLIPKLRFPEFRDEGEWREVQLGKCLLLHPDYGINAPAVPYSDNLPTYLRITDISEEGYFIRDKMVSVDRDVVENNYLKEGDIVLARTGASVGKSYKYKKEDGKLVFAGFLIRVKPDKEKLISDFLSQFFLTEQYWRWVNFTSMRSGQPGINGNEYSLMPLLLPLSLSEQQKIADCLSSLDELIKAQSQKIDALKDHKKGLMQQLFPADGETVPKLRFPEFQNSKEWSYVAGDQVFKNISNKNHKSDLPILAISQEYGAVPREVIDYTVIVSDKSIASYKVVEIGDFIISLRSFQGGIEYSNYKGLCSPAYIILQKRKSDIVDGFFRYYFKSEVYIQALNKNIEGIRDGKMISYKQFSEILLPMPQPNEQQRIADCLTSLDELIDAHSKKLDALKDHKKGLMQQLFPGGSIMP